MSPCDPIFLQYAPIRSPAPCGNLGLRGVAALAGLALLVSLADALDYRATQAIATALGPLPMLLAIPLAFQQARAGSRSAVYLLLGWVSCLVGALTIAALLRGWLAVYGLDLDGFKLINDRLEHDDGDALLVLVGQRLCAQLHSSDVVARVGGDEFVILVAGLAGDADAQRLGSKRLSAVEQPLMVDRQICRVGLSIGLALAPHDGRDANDPLKQAGAAMCAGKQAGRHTLRRGAELSGLTG